MGRCIVCDQESVERFLDLGYTALANKFLREEELSVQEEMYPLRVGFCHTCGHVQLTERVPPSSSRKHATRATRATTFMMRASRRDG